MALKKKSHDVEKSPAARRAPQEQEAAQAAGERLLPADAAVAALQRAAGPPPSALRPADVLALQRAVGNRAVRRMLDRRPGAPPPQPSTPANVIQLKDEDEEPLQARFETDRTKENRTGLPDGLKSGVESLSGISLDGVHVHYNSPEPARVNALAYTRGGDIYVAPGQERHLPHEAWHVVQQRQGRVRPTMQLKEGVPVNDDEGLEREADVMGARALTHTVSSPPANPAQKTDELSGGNGARNPVQRLVGFEVEYQVPTFGTRVVEVELKGGKQAASVNLNRFLFGGFEHNTKLGGSAEPGENSFRLTTDHNSAVSREPIRAKLAEMGKLEPSDATDGDASSNLEYVTSPVDELAKGSDKVFNDLIDKVAAHAASTFSVAKPRKAGMIPAPASTAATGMPVNTFKAWLSEADFNELEPTLNAFEDNILDSCYLQATIGVIPGAVGTLFVKAADTEGLHYTGGQFTQFYTAVKTVSAEAGSAVAGHKYITGLQKLKDTQTLNALSGMIRLLVMYLVAEAFSQTSAFPGGTIKNALPFLSKVDPTKISDAGPEFMKLFDEVPDDFVTALAAAISGRPEITVQYWRELGYEARVRKATDKVTAGSVENLAKLFLQGKNEGAGVVTPGSKLEKLDPVNASKSLFSPHNKGQKGIPLEYRYLKARPTAAGLKTELLKVVKEARDVNLSQSSAEEREAIEKQVKE